MAADLGTISTGVDGFIKLVRDAGRIEMTDAATRMGISRQILEEWAAVLEEQGLVKIDYQFTKVYLVWIAKTKAEVEDTTSRIADIKTAEVRHIESRVEELLELGKSLDEAVNEFKQISDIFEFKMGGVKDRLDKLRELKKSRDEINFRSTEVANKFKRRITDMKDAVDKSSKKAEEAKVLMDDLDGELRGTEPAMVKLRVLATDADIAVDKVVKRSRELKDEVAKMEKGYADLEKAADSLGGAVKTGSAQVMGVRQDLDKEVDTLLQLSSSVTESENEHKTEMAKSLADLDKLMKDFEGRVGRKALMAGKLKTLKSERDGLVSELEAQRKELMALDVTKGGVDTVLEKIESVRARIGETEKKIDDFEKEQEETTRETWKLFEVKKPAKAAGERD